MDRANVGEKFQLQFLPSFLFDLIVFFLVFSWVIQQPCFHDVKCCLLDARGASFLTSRNENYLASVAFKFLRFPRPFISNLVQRANASKAHFSEVSRAVNLVTTHETDHAIYFELFWPLSTWKDMVGSIWRESRNAKPIHYFNSFLPEIYIYLTQNSGQEIKFPREKIWTLCIPQIPKKYFPPFFFFLGGGGLLFKKLLLLILFVY